MLPWKQMLSQGFGSICLTGAGMGSGKISSYVTTVWGKHVCIDPQLHWLDTEKLLLFSL